MGTIHVHRELKYKSPIINKVVRNLSLYAVRFDELHRLMTFDVYLFVL